MRMRRKKNLEPRLAGCAAYLQIPVLSAERDFRTAGEKPAYLDLDGWFSKPQPLWLEIGCGKGQFAVELAERRPDINILAVEKVANVVVAAAERAQAASLPNLRFLCLSAEYLPHYLPPGSVERLFLNFSCPYPKARYAGHRLTSERFLPIYAALLTPGAEIHQKTDNRQFFEFSLASLSRFGFVLQNISLDLHHSDFAAENIVTEYEKRFTDLGQPIYRLEAYLPQRKSPQFEVMSGNKIFKEKDIE